MHTTGSQRGGGPKARRARAGFTLVELAVVLATISLLVALVASAARKALAMAQERACAANLRCWGVAFVLYAAEHDGFLPHPDGRERNSPPGSGDATHPEHEHGYVDVLPPYLDQRAWREYPEGQKPTSGIWQCPSARLKTRGYGYNPQQTGYFSYAMNSYLAHDFLFGLPWDAALQPSYLAYARCVSPSRTILMFEQTLDPDQGYGQAGSLGTAGRFAAEDARALAERHCHTWGGLGSNVLFLDGHVAWRNDLWDRSLRNPRIPKRGDLTWFPYYY